ncbi:MAG TPA: choice-of-anchor tandem repeat GloVer-containing protein [Pirellulales bacterium]|nr:choice-of-anchor tandem repeat GloVer-containing protein [Pirellulales bacterium]
MRCCILLLAVSVVAISSTASAQQQYILKTLVSFAGSNGDKPQTDLFMDASGNLFGTTVYGGAHDYGTVFEVTNHTLTTLVSFNGSNGQSPAAGLSADSSGNLYGTTMFGGAHNDGTVFEVANNSNHTLTTLVSFGGTNGSQPETILTADSSGNLYGATEGGGTNGNGTVFKMSNNINHTLTTLVNFNIRSTGQGSAGLLADAGGNLYGPTWWGTSAYGAVFKVANDANHTFSTLATFNGTNGYKPTSNLVADAYGNLYGTTAFGGANNDGTVFEVANDTNHTLTNLVSFNGTNGQTSEGHLIADAAGNLYGTTGYGGANGNGTVFEIANNANHSLYTLFSFANSNGTNPAGVIMDASGNLFGTTIYGGANNEGTVFELSPILLGDFNFDGHVDAADIAAMEQTLANLPSYQSANGLSNSQLLAIGDINGDGVFNNADLQAFLDYLQSGGGSTNPVPEPSTFVLAVLAFGLFVVRRFE